MTPKKIFTILGWVSFAVGVVCGIATFNVVEHKKILIMVSAICLIDAAFTLMIARSVKEDIREK